ncbi:NADH-quinone oxidoreductase subunit NuoF [Candidatus Zinderia endosymbiont of Aphrophora alni]|uniref:NADH-quinone oxidoreductase subunit NuoF n=1 Tax=Candidatus Zinderia endosymbiont of Aphrophora alni TaxID=3077951 RepID=UPI0030CF4724
MSCLHNKHINPLIFLNLNGKNWHLNDYIKRGGYKSLKKILYNNINPKKIIKKIKNSGLRGRGGAGFSTGLKWSFINYKYPGQKYLICNSDEGEPGTFKDQDIILYNPHAIIEGMIIGGYTMGITIGYNYIHGEIFKAYQRFNIAIKEAIEANILGNNILGSNLKFNLYIHRSYGSYICGEETALLESIEGKKPQPRFKPPFPANFGLYGKPTIINNTETFASIPFIIKLGAKKYLKIGKPNNGGTKIFSISGDIKNPGNYEVPLGTPFKKLLKISGGMKNKKKIKSVIPGGISTPILLGEIMIKINMDYDDILKHGSMLGSGAVIILNETRCMVKILMNISNFFKKESCGKCTPCREGTGWIYSIVKKIENGFGKEEDLEKLLLISKNILGNTICALGDAASISTSSFIKTFYKEFLYHIKYKKCLIF